MTAGTECSTTAFASNYQQRSQRSLRSTYRKVVAILTSLAVVTTTVFVASGSATAVGPGTIDGTVFVDANRNGANDTEAGLPGVTVTAYGADGGAASTTTSGGSGTYSLTGLSDGTPYRVEFTNLPAGYLSGPSGPDSETSVTFATPEAIGVDFGVVEEIVCTGSLPAGALLNTYNTAANCGVLADLVNPQDAFGLLDVSNLAPASGRLDQTATTPMLHQANWEIGPLGNTFGLTIDSYRGDIYAAASSNFSSGMYSDATNSLRASNVRYGDIGGGADSLAAAGTVYQIDAVTGTPTVFAQLPQQTSSIVHENCDFFGTGTITRSTGVGLGNAIYDPIHDQMFVANWEDGHIYRLNMQGDILDAYDPDADDNGAAGIANGDVPFGLALDAASGRIYWGTLFTQQVVSVDLVAGGWQGTSAANGAGTTIFRDHLSEQVNLTLNTTIPADPAYTTTNWFREAQRNYHIADLELLPNGQLLAGVRMGCRDNIHSGYNHYGQTHVLTDNGSGIYTSSSGALDITAEDAGGTNYAEEDNYGGVAHYVDGGGSVDYVVSTSDFNNEGDVHGIVAFPISSAASAPVTPAGVAAYSLGDDPKGVGGEVQVHNAVTCPIPQIEIGNYVWLDLDGDGVQDPGELPLADVTVTLYAADGVTVLAVTTTDADGEYIFTAVDGVDANSSYQIGFDVTSTTTTLPGGFLPTDLSETTVDTGAGANADANDSDVNGGRIIVVTAEENDHTFDAGYTLPTFDLALQKTVASGPSTVLLGGPVVFNLTITNQGEAVQTIEVTDYVETGAFTYDVADNAAGVANDNGDGDSFTYSWGATPTVTIIGNQLDTGESITIPITLEVDPTFDGTITLENWAEISNFDSDQNSGNGNAFDGTLSDTDSTPDAIDGSDGSQGPGENAAADHVDDEIGENGLAGGDEDDHDVAVLKWYDLTLIKERSSTQPYAIDLSGTPPTAAFDITVANQSPYRATAIQVTEYLPAGTAIALAQPAMPTLTNNGTAVAITPAGSLYTINTLAPGDSVTFGVVLEITDATLSPFVNAAEISSFRGEDGEVAADIDSIPDAADTDVLLLDPLNPDNDRNSHNDLAYDPDNDGNVNEATPTDEDDHDAEVVVTQYDLALQKTVNPSSANVPGGPITFDLTIVNQGRPVQKVVVTDYVPTSLSYSAGDNPAGSVIDDGDGDTLSYVWDAGSPVVTLTGAALDSGESVTIPLVLQVAPSWAGEDIVNWAEISNFDNDQLAINGDAVTPDIVGDTLQDADSTPDAIDGSAGGQGDGENAAVEHVDNEIGESGLAGGDEDDHDVARLIWHDLTLVKERAAGQGYEVDLTVDPPQVRWSITVANQGNGDATQIAVADYVPVDMSVAPSQPAMPTLTNGGAAVSITETAPTYLINSLATDDSVTFDIILQVDDVGTPEFVNAAEITSFADAGGNPATDVDSTPDGLNDDPVIVDAGNADNEDNSHNDIAYDPDNDGNVHEQTVGDEDDHDAEVVIIVYRPNIDIEKTTNGVQADAGTGPLVLQGDPVNWVFVVTNNGNVDLSDVVVTDVVTTDNGTAADPAGVVCDWVNSSDNVTPARNLSVNESVTCTSSSTAEFGQYANDSSVAGTPVADAETADPDSPVRLNDVDGNPVGNVSDDDPSAYFGPNASIDIEKDTNGNQADALVDQDTYTIGDPINWTFVVTNDGNVDLADVTVADTVTIDNGTIADPDGVVCNWGASTDAATPARNLSLGESVTCTSSSNAEAGQYRNVGDVVGTPVDDAVTADPNSPTPIQDESGTDLGDVTDDDPSHYYGVPQPSIDIEKDTNGTQADLVGDQDYIAIGDPVNWTFVVRNNGNVDLADVVVTDSVVIDNGTTADPAGVVCDWATSSDGTTPARNLSVNENVTCTSASIAEPGQYGNLADVVGTPVADATTADPDAPVALQDIDGDDLADVTDDDPSHYFGLVLPAIDIEKDTNGFQADTGTGPLVFDGDAVVWTFEVENTGNVALGNVTVTDAVTTDNGTAVDPAGVVCDWANSSDPATPDQVLSVEETVTCTASSTAELGQYRNNSNVVGAPLANDGSALLGDDGNPLPNVTDQDPSGYFGPNASIDIEKDTNGNQADLIGDQDSYAVGDPITWNFVVVNDGNVDLADVTVADTVVIDNDTGADPFGVQCDWANSSDNTTPARNLSIGESVDCFSTSVAVPGQYGNLGDVVGTPVDDAVTADPNSPTPLQDENGTDLADVIDDDPSHYYAAPEPAIDIEKDTNGTQADVLGDQDYLAIGSPVTWTFVVENTGDVDLADVVVTDSVTIDNGTVADPAGVVCDWATSSDNATPARNLSVNETVTCTSTSTAVAGQYRNDSNVTGTPVADATTADPDAPVALQDIDGNDLADVTDDDPSHYYGLVSPAIDIEKDTNGFQADTGTGPLVLAGQPVVWTFEVENTGNVALGNVTVSDAVTTDNGTAADPAGVVCDWANSSDPATPDQVLSVNETVTCTASSTAELGQYRNDSNVAGTPLAADGSPLLDDGGVPVPNVTDQDPSGYFGPNASIDIEKDTNGNQADLIGDQDSYAVGDPIAWTFVVVNDGNVDLADVTVADTVTIDNGTVVDPAGVVCDWANSSDVATPARNLAINETVTCTSGSTAEAGQYRNVGDIVGTPVDDAVTADPNSPTRLQDGNGADLGDVTDDDPSHYYAAPAPAIDIEKDTNGNQADTLAAQDVLAIGNPVTWTFVVENTGDVDLADVVITDSVVIDNGTAADPAGVVCDWANSSDNMTPARNLSVGETVTCTSGSIAAPGQYGNLADVVGTPVADATTADPDAPVALQDIAGNDLADVVDDDPSHYYAQAVPSIDIEKDTNGVQADVGTGPVIFEGDPVVWTFVVENTGNVALGSVTVTDAVTADNGTAADPAGVVCDWANSSDPATPDQVLSVNETVTCTASSTAAVGQYRNDSNVAGAPLANDGTALLGDDGVPVPNVTDQDPSGYFGPSASIDIEKDTNGNQADVLADQDVIAIGDPVVWTFEVQNTGNVDLAAVAVTDAVTTDNGTAADPNGVVCDWPNSSDPATPAGNLSVNETVTCASTSTAAAGQYRNDADVVGTPVSDAVGADPIDPTPLSDLNGVPMDDVVDADPSHYYGNPQPSIDIEKDTNGNQADVLADQDIIPIGAPVTWTFVVTNDGNVDLADVIVSDSVTVDNGTVVDPAGVVCDWVNSSDAATPARNLSVNETVTCTSTSTAEAGQYRNDSDVVGTPVADATTADPDAPVALQDIDGNDLADVVDDDPSHYYGDAIPGIDIEKDTNGFQADTGTGPLVLEGDPVTWTYVVTNIGTSVLGDVVVTDTVTLDNGTTADPAGLVCDWANSSEAATPAGTLARGETVTCTASSSAELGQYRNDAAVVAMPIGADGNRLLDEDGNPFADVTDDDPSAYFGPSASIDIEKDTNGNQADVLADQDILSIGAPVTWNFVVTNDGNVDLANVIVSDSVTIDNGTAADLNGVVCDWANSSDAATPARNLSVGETVACSSTSVAVAGQYRNDSDVVGTPVADATTADPNAPTALQDENGNTLGDVVDADPSHYYAEPQPSIDIEKDTNGNQADVQADQDIIAIGSPVTWTFVVVNDGNVDLADVIVTDSVTVDNGTVVDPAGVVCDWVNSSDAATPERNLAVNETVTCTSTSTAEAGQYRNDSDVVGTPVADATTADPDAPVALQDIDGNDLADVTDDDPSHYFGDAIPQIDIEKDTNGFQADTGTGPLVFQGNDVTWTFVVTNTGTAALGNVTVSDTVTTDNGTANDPAGVVCDWANSSDIDTPADTLAPLETVTCTASSSAELGQYANVADVVGMPIGADGTPLLDPDGTPVPNVTDDDPSAYFGPDASIDIEKDTNGNQADVLADQDIISVGSAVVWTFEVENTGNVDLADVNVTDVATIDNGTVPDPDGVACDWANSSDAATPARNLSVGETVTCTAASQAAAGQYANLSAVVGTPVADATTADPFAPTALVDETGAELPAVTDSDPSHYFGEASPSIDIEKDTNGNQADVLADQSNLAIGADVTWTFVVVNTGDVDLADVVVTDTVTIDNGTAPDPDGVVCDWTNSSDATTPARNLSVGETVMCTSASTVENGQYRNDSDVTGTPVADATTADPDAPIAVQDVDGNDLVDVVDADPSHYFGAQSAILIEKDTNGNQADVLADQDNIEAGQAVVWTFVVTNTGNVDLADVIVSDTVTTDNGTASEPDGVVCDWANSSDAATPARNLSIGETVTCTSASTAVAGQYRNDADVIGTPVADATTADADNPTPVNGPDGQPIPKPTDTDPSHYFGVDASIDIEKDTNGNQADVVADQDVLSIGTPITWTFVVTNTGNADLADVTVSDTITIDNGTAADPAGVVCDWNASSDPLTPADNLSVGETVTCTSTSTSTAGQYSNLGDVAGTPVDDATSLSPTPLVDGDGQPIDDVTDNDPSHYFGGAQPSIDIEKDTNSNQADTMATQDMIAIGDPVTWAFVVTNTGDVDLADVTVSDTVTIDNGTVAPDNIVCDWENSSDAATPIEALSVGETVTCLASSTAAPGQYGNLGEVTGTPVFDATVGDPQPVIGGAGEPLGDVTDKDPSHYMGAAPSIDVEKDTNGTQADLIGEQQELPIGSDVTWTFVVTNDGNTDLANVVLVDDTVIDNGTTPSAIDCDWAASSNEDTPAGALSMGETVTCTATGTAAPGQYGNLAEVAGTPVVDATDDTPEPVIVDGEPAPPVDDADPSHYFGRANPSIDIEKDTNGVQADTIAEQGGVDTGADLVWTFVVTNTGDVDLAEVALADAVTIDNGTDHDADGIVCDWANSSDPATPASRLSVDETVTCRLQGTAGVGQYGNLSEVVATPVTTASGVPELLLGPDGTPLADVIDEDPSHVFAGFFPAIDIEKATNGVDADTMDGQPFVDPSGAVVWTFEVRNTGNVDLAGVEVEDAITADNGTVTPAVVCDWDTSSDPATPARNLSVGETVSCTSSSTAEEGQYANLSSVTATPVADATIADPDAPTPLRDIDGEPVADVSDDDPSHYFGPVFDLALRKQLSDGTNLGQTKIGETVTFIITLFNQGNVPASNIEVVDYLPTNLELADPDWVAIQGGALIALSDTTLQPGETTTVDITVKVVAGGEEIGTEIEVEAEISEADGVDNDGDPIMLQGVNGDPLALLDVDSVPDANNDEAPIEDEIDNADGDEDDHDRVGLIIEADPVEVVDPPTPTPTTPNSPAPNLPTFSAPPTTPAPPSPTTPEPSGPLAFTGADSAHLAAIAAMLITAGGALMILGRRRDEEYAE